MPARIALAVMAWFGFVNLYMVRFNLSVAIVAMVKRNESNNAVADCFSYNGKSGSNSQFNITEELDTYSWSNQDNRSQTPSLNSFMEIREEEERDEDGEMMWDETTQGLVLGSFFYGYALTQVIGGRGAELYGTKRVYGICILAGGISALLSPMMARFHYGALIGLRIVQGMFQGASWPSMHACIARWIPPIERPQFIAIVCLAATLSSAMTLPLCGVIIDNHGWPAAFYVMGVLSIAWCCIWFSFMYDSPSEHPRISAEELHYIQSALRESGTVETSSSRVPWKQIFTSLPVWAILAASFGNGWGISLLFAQLPTYMKNVLGFSIKANGALSALPFLSRYIGAIMWSSLGSWLIARNHLSIVSTRRVFGILALWVPGIMIIGVAYAGCNWQLNVALFCIALFFNGAITTSNLVNHTDIAPNFSGTLLGIDNTLGSVISFIVPVVTGVMTDGQQTLEAWRRVFWICAPIYVIGGIFFLIFVSGEVQPWNNMRVDQQADSTQVYSPVDTRETVEDNQATYLAKAAA